MKVRRVVTGHTPDGKAMVVSDTEVDPITAAMIPGEEVHRLWGGDSAPTFPDDGSPPPIRSYFPPVGGFRFAMLSIPPLSETRPAVDSEAAAEEFEEKLPGFLALLDTAHPGMHRTDTVDFEYVISGEIWLELDDGLEVHLRPGDTVVQNGTRHAWRNKGTEPCRMVVILIGAHRTR